MINVLPNNDIVKYYNQIESGEVIVSLKVKRVYQKIVEDMLKSSCGESEWEYSQSHADHVINFIEKFCRHSKGKWAGKPVTLEIWQKAFICAAYGFIHRETRERKYTEIFLAISRKAGKSLISSCLGLYHFMFDGEYGASVACAASKKDQAKIVFDEARLMVRKSPALSKRVTVRRSDLWYDDTESTFKPLSSDSNTLDGENISLSILDECHAIPDMNLYDVLKDSQTARNSPMFLTITTMGSVRGGIFDNLYDIAEKTIKGYDDGNFNNESFLPLVYELDDPITEVHDEEMWFKANPMLGITKDIEKVREKYQRAMSNSALLPNFLCKEMNVRSSSSVSWLQFTEYNNEATYDLEEKKFRYFIGGVDLSQSGDWTSACALMKKPNDETIYAHSMFWITRKMYDDNPDKLPLETWERQGYLRVCDGKMINHKEVVAWFEELQHQKDIYMFKVGYDRWSSSLFVDTMNQSFGETSTVKVAQGAQTLSAPMYHLAALFKSKMVNYNNNPILKLHIGNVVVKTDDNANIRPIKGTDDKKKIDGLMALLDAFVVYLDDAEEYDSLC